MSWIEITVCDLSDTVGGGWAHQPQQKIAIDPVLGRIAFPSGRPTPSDVRAISLRFQRRHGGRRIRPQQNDPD